MQAYLSNPKKKKAAENLLRALFSESSTSLTIEDANKAADGPSSTSFRAIRTCSDGLSWKRALGDGDRGLPRPG